MSTNPPQDDSQIDELRQLLLGPELKKLEQLTDLLNSPEKFSIEIGNVLPQAMLKSSQQGEQLSEAMVPTVEEIVRLSIKRDINKFASALFPVIGPAIRKSIAETIRQMLQSLNQVLEHGLSWQGIKWRIESMRTGISFAQIVMLNSLEFQVDQVFLIHRKTGILLNHVEQEDSLNQNADMVSSMLTAIGDFVGDSFDVENRQDLDSIQVGDFSILIEQSPEAILAVASRGNAPKSLRVTMQQVLEDIQSRFNSDLDNFKGDTLPFELCRGQLLLCMEQSQHKTKNKKLSLKSKLIWIVAFILLFYWMTAKIYVSTQQHDYVDLLKKEPGIIITQVSYGSDQLSIQGLKDPLARDPQKFMALTTLDPEEVNLQFEPYQSLEKLLVEKRLLKILKFPKNVSISFQNNLLTIQGYASEDKIKTISMMAPLISGIEQIDISNLKSTLDLSSLNTPDTVQLTLDIDNGHLVSSGIAQSQWKKLARNQVDNIAGILSYDDAQLKNLFDLSVFNAPETVLLSLQDKVLSLSGHASTSWIATLESAIQDYDAVNEIDSSQLLNSDETQLKSDIQLLQKEIIYFDAALSFNFDANESFNRVTRLVKQIITSANLLSRPVQIIIKGYSDSIGNFEDNVFLSLERADYVAQYLFNTGISPQYIFIKGLEVPVKKETTSQEQSYNRRVTFDVSLQ